MNNQWNGFIYKLWSPIYDVFFNRGIFLKARKTIFKNVSFQPGEKVLFVGVGTGADIEQVPYRQLDITAIDYSQDMLHKAKQKFPNSSISFIQMDAQQLNFPDNTFDYVIGSLLLSVVPDGEKAINEMVRVAKDDSYILLFDKFLPKGKNISIPKRMIRQIIKLLGTDIGLSFEELRKAIKQNHVVLEDADILFDGMYRKIVIQKIS